MTNGTGPGPRADAAETLRQVALTRVSPGVLEVTNERGGTLRIGGADADFTPVELLLAALAGCAAVNIEELTGRRAEPHTFDVTASGHKVRDESGGHLVDLAVDVDARFPDGDAGDAARAVLPRVVRQTHERICTVSRTVERGTPVRYTIAGRDLGEA